MALDPWTLRWVAKPVTRVQGLHILERDHYCCQYCGLDGRSSFENALLIGVDFVMPRARRGRKVPSNLVACCRPCNLIKGRRLFDNFEEAKAYVLTEREKLRKAWQEKTSRQRRVATNAVGEEIQSGLE
jgi:5-methylcytosine-specific restriction endonuclease McrA